MSFAVSAESYDRFMGRFAVPWVPVFADFTGIRPGMRVADIGCGTGALTTELVARLGSDAVSAVDPSIAMVMAGRERHPGVEVKKAAAEHLPFDDDCEHSSSCSQSRIGHRECVNDRRRPRSGRTRHEPLSVRNKRSRN